MTLKLNPKRSSQLLPSLLDRLTDQEPRRQQETKLQYFFNLAQYRKAVLRDILYLLNTTCWQSTKLEQVLPKNVQNSTINYGITAFSGNNFADIEWQKVEDLILTALINFEPRLDADSLQVTVILDADTGALDTQLIIEIKGDLKLNPYPQEFLLRTAMDIETGMFNLVEGKVNE